MRNTFKKIISMMLLFAMVVMSLPAIAEQEGYYSPAVATDAELVKSFEIINGEGSTVFVGKSITLSLPEGYGEAAWESSDPAIATVDNGEVTGVAAGSVEITAVSGERRATTKITVMEAAKDKATIIVQFEKNTIEYNGKEHTIQYTVTCDNDAIDLNKVTYSGTLPSRKDVGAMSVKADSVTFTYEGTEQVDIVVNPGSLRINPKEITVKPNDITVEEDQLSSAELTATVDGLIEGDSIEYNLDIVTVEGAPMVQASGASKQGNYKISYKFGNVTVKDSWIEYPLYNIAKIHEDNKDVYYRLKKTTIKTKESLETYLVGKSKGQQKPLTINDYKVSDYDFENSILTYKNKKYAYITRMNEPDLSVDGYYNVSMVPNEEVVAGKQKIGGTSGWLVPKEDQYNDKNEQDSFKRNFIISFTDNASLAEFKPVDVYTMLSINGAKNYYRLKKSTMMTTADINTMNNAQKINESDYVLKRYNFKDVVITRDGVDYVYNDGSIKDEYTSYYTVVFEGVQKESRINGDLNWYRNNEGFLDNSRPDYKDLPNNTVAFHENYKATLYKGKERPRKVTISSDWQEGRLAFAGAKITLTATLTGFGDNYTLQWQYSPDGKTWYNEEGANGLTYTYELTEETARYYWRVEAN